MNFILGVLAGFCVAILFFRIIDGCWPWSRDRDLFAEEDAARDNEMAPVPQNEMTRIAYRSASGHAVSGSGGGGGGYAPPMVEVQPENTEEQRFTTEEMEIHKRVEEGDRNPFLEEAYGNKPDPLAR